MRVDELALCVVGEPFAQFPNRPQPKETAVERYLAGMIDCFCRVLELERSSAAETS